MVKDAPNHIPTNMIGLAHTSSEIPEDGNVPIFLLVLTTPKSLRYTTAPNRDHIIHLLRGSEYNMYMAVNSVPACNTPTEMTNGRHEQGGTGRKWRQVFSTNGGRYIQKLWHHFHPFHHNQP